MANSNRKTGTTFEQELCQTLSRYGFWAHNLAQNRQGQPFDVIAARNGKTYIIDCKVCEHNRFPLSRMEENQRSAMELWRSTGNGEGWFALRLSGGSIYMVSLASLDFAGRTDSTLNAERIKHAGVHLYDWVKQCE